MSAQAAGPYPDINFRQLDSWIVIHQNNTATFYVGKTDCGQGTGTAFRQMMADELDLAYDKTTCIMGSTDVTAGPGRVGRLRCDSNGRLADAPRGSRGSSRPAGNGVRAICGARRSTRRQRGRDLGESGSLEDGDVR